MISSVADDQEENEEISQSSVSPTGHEQSMMIQSRYDFSNVEKQTKVISNKHTLIDKIIHYFIVTCLVIYKNQIEFLAYKAAY